MGVKCSVGYYGPSINNTYEAFKQYDLACPNVCKNGLKNFWKSRCIERIGNKEIPSCYKGCKEAAKYPELKAKMDKVLEEWEKGRAIRELREKQLTSDFCRIRYKEGFERARVKPKYNKKERAKIVSMYLNADSVNDTMIEVKCGRDIVAMYRKMYREGVMDKKGNITA